MTKQRRKQNFYITFSFILFPFDIQNIISTFCQTILCFLRPLPRDHHLVKRTRSNSPSIVILSPSFISVLSVLTVPDGPTLFQPTSRQSNLPKSLDGDTSDYSLEMSLYLPLSFYLSLSPFFFLFLLPVNRRYPITRDLQTIPFFPPRAFFILVKRPTNVPTIARLSHVMVNVSLRDQTIELSKISTSC